MRLITVIILLFFALSVKGQPVQLAMVYQDENVEDYLVSEKLDGIRAIWDGKEFSTRQGNVLNAPEWFTKGWPNVWLDGELWAGRGQFHHVQKTVLDSYPDDEAWRKITYMVFDAPASGDTFFERYEFYNRLIKSTENPTIQPVEQFEMNSVSELYSMLDEIVSQGGEGVMLHQKTALFRDGRSNALLKLKPFKDAEARVVAHVEGKGKYQGMMGSLIVALANGTQFRVGTGFSDTDRLNPPKIGEYITFRYQGLTQNGLPRFASYLRIRQLPFEFRDPE